MKLIISTDTDTNVYNYGFVDCKEVGEGVGLDGGGGCCCCFT